MEHIKFDIQDRVARITFARPPLNILNIAMMREINAALNECAGQKALAAIVFDAAPGMRAFSAGVAVEEHVEETVFKMLDAFHSIFRSLNQISKPVVAVVDGPALGGGCELVAAADIVIASERARFGQPEIKLGVFPPVAAVLLPRIVGEKKAREMILLGEIVDAQEAVRLGLVNHLAAGEELKEQTESVLTKLRELSAVSLQFTRAALDLGGKGDFESALTEVENLYLNDLMKTGDASEGVQSFMEKRKPEWKNR
ncbi:MAG TPA: enoyl-CoA hydratase/isomerase family protein [Pyrinomonadaceae bacterium]|jgi:cyclohexa-1,5-dienecarbonyl-CoA hydratase|nr:enoyl-CoA hydratase/isomerase family protein [Pyrinomonadaceae bacterium]